MLVDVRVKEDLFSLVDLIILAILSLSHFFNWPLIWVKEWFFIRYTKLLTYIYILKKKLDSKYNSTIDIFLAVCVCKLIDYATNAMRCCHENKFNNFISQWNGFMGEADCYHHGTDIIYFSISSNCKKTLEEFIKLRIKKKKKKWACCVHGSSHIHVHVLALLNPVGTNMVDS